MDNRQEFLQALTKVLTAYCRTGMVNLELVENEEGDFCKITYKSGYSRLININGDSNLAIIEDILRFLY